MRKKLITLCVLAATVMGWAVGAYANGYKILCVKSAKATAMGEAFIVQADDPSAIAFNPAGLSQLRGNQVNLHATLCNAYTEHEAPSGEKTDNEDRWQMVPSFFATTDMGRDDMAAGLGVYFPNGLSSEWADDSFARYVATFSELNVADISPAFGMRVTERLMIGGGIDFYYSEAQLKRMVDLGSAAGAPGAMDTGSKIEGDGTAWGFNLGTIFRIHPRHSVALTYHHPFEIDYEGDMTLADTRTDVDVSIGFPGVVVVGYAFRPSDQWKMEFNADWTHWRDVGDTTVDFHAPGMTDTALEQDLENTLAYKFGVEYSCSDQLDLRCGYIYNENATPDETFRPSLPDTDMHFLTTGFGYHMEHITVDAALQLVFYETRTVDNNVDLNEALSSSSVDGTYRTFAPCVSLAATYLF